ncbi:19039_t:CDS:2, partial [Cetraspora pellucida]
MTNKANSVNGEWRLQIEHVMLYILGLDPDYLIIVKSRATLHKLGGMDGTQVWDTVLTVIAVNEARLAEDSSNHQSIVNALDFLDDAQIKKNSKDPERCYHENLLGAWSFSTHQEGYYIADCT